MTETIMPVTEATLDTPEVYHYELAFHVLPTVTEGEVTDVFIALKALVSAHGGSLQVEEAPERFELAYPIVKRTEGKNRSYKSAYFGWVRFTAPAGEVARILTEVEAHQQVLRALLVKLSLAEITHPFYFHDALVDKKVVTIDLEDTQEEVIKEEVADTAEVAEEVSPAEEKTIV